MGVKDLPEDSPMCDIDKAVFCSKLKSLFSKYDIDNLFSFLDRIDKCKKNELFRKNCSASSFCLVDNIENIFFQLLLGGIKDDTPLFKYTNAASIIYVSKNEQCMTSIVGMNDATECMYADTYLREIGYDTYLDDSIFTLLGSKAFITSFSTKEDDLTMWRLYGDDAKGIAYEYKVENNNLLKDFYLAPVSYANEDGYHKELNLIADMGEMIIDDCKFEFKNLFIWKYFFKPKEYKVEDEVRLLYFEFNPQKKAKWVETGTGLIAPIKVFSIEDKSDDYEKKVTDLYPLALHQIWLGPRMPEIEANKESINQLLKESLEWKPIKISAIHNYRERKK